MFSLVSSGMINKSNPVAVVTPPGAGGAIVVPLEVRLLCVSEAVIDCTRSVEFRSSNPICYRSRLIYMIFCWRAVNSFKVDYVSICCVQQSSIPKIVNMFCFCLVLVPVTTILFSRVDDAKHDVMKKESVNKRACTSNINF